MNAFWFNADQDEFTLLTADHSYIPSKVVHIRSVWIHRFVSRSGSVLAFNNLATSTCEQPIWLNLLKLSPIPFRSPSDFWLKSGAQTGKTWHIAIAVQ